MHSKRRQELPARRGFTLVELLIVVVIIVLLMGLAVTAYFRFTNQQIISNTQSRLQTLDKALHEQWRKVEEDARKEPPSDAARLLAGNDPTGARSRVIWIKVRLAEAFPMSYAEIQTPWVYQPIAALGNLPLIPPDRHKYNQTYLRQLPNNAKSNDPKTEPAACLLIALTSKKGGSAVTTFDPSYKNDTDGDGVPELVDSWGKPFEFFRFGIGLNATNLQSMAPATNKKNANFRDPLDPAGTLTDPNWVGTPLRTLFEQLFHPISPNNGNAPTFYVAPVIASAGLNNKMGLDPANRNIALDPNDINAAVSEGDNLYSFSSTIGGGTGQ